MSTMTDIFNPGGAAPVEPKNTEIYNPNYKQGKNGIYKSVIRFLPWHVDPMNNVIKKRVAYLVNPTNPTEKRYIDNPEDSPITSMYWRLVNTNNPKFEDFAKKHLGSAVNYYGLVQIMSDEQKPELVGQIKVFRFTKKIYDKIQAELNPPQGEGINPFHPIYGRKFSLVITKQGDFPNYDQSAFFDERSGTGLLPSGMWYTNPQTGQFEIATESCDRNLVFNYLKEKSPDLSKYAIKEWNDSDRAFVTNVLTVTENYMLTGAIMTPQQATTQQGYGALNNTIPNPTFPGATFPTTGVPTGIPTPVTPTPNVGTPVPTSVPVNAPVGSPVYDSFSVGTPVPTSAPVNAPVGSPVYDSFSVGTPVPTSVPVNAPIGQPMGTVPTPQSMVMGVEIPVVTPQGVASGTPGPSRGMDVDDILSKL